MQESHRVFFALWPDAGVGKRLARAAREVQDQYGGRAMRPETLHLTLAFIGQVAPPRLQVLQQIAASLSGEPFVLRLDRIGCWRHNRIVWAGCVQTPPPLADFAARLTSEVGGAGFAVEKRPFAAHVTLVRNACCGAEQLPLEPIDWAIDGFSLMESALGPAGACYSPLAQWPLRA